MSAQIYNHEDQYRALVSLLREALRATARSLVDGIALTETRISA